MKVLWTLLATTCTAHNFGTYFSQRTIAGKISVQKDLSMLFKAMQISGLDDFLECAEFCKQYTIFCPKDQAFFSFPHLHWFDNDQYKEHLKQLVEYHIIPGRIYEEDFLETHANYETLQGEIVVASIKSPIREFVVVLNGDATVIGYDKRARNGVVQGVSKVLLPKFAQENVLDVVQRSASLFFRALELTGVDEYLRSHGPMTILAPSDIALESMTEAMMINDIEALAKLVKHHIFPDLVLLDEDLEEYGDAHLTLLGPKVILGSNASIVAANTLGSNGIVHIIDSSLHPVPPPNLWDLLSQLPELTYFRNCMIAAGLNASLQAAGPMTLFAPSNKAMKSFQVRDGNQRDKRDLLYHIVKGQHGRQDLSDRLFRTASGDNMLVDVRSDSEVILNGHVEVSSFDQEASNGVLHVLSERLHRPLDLVSTAATRGLTSFVRALELTKLSTAFTEEGPYTIFGWTDNAWDILDDDLADELLNDLARLRRVVLYHIVPQYLLFDDLQEGNYTTLLQRDFELSFEYLNASKSFQVRVNDAYVTGLDTLASNGCLHRLHKVLDVP